MATFSNISATINGQKGQNEFYCTYCDYKCCKKYSWERHTMTSKHAKATNGNILATINEEKGQKGQKTSLFSCDNCNKEYIDRTGLWRHKKKCCYQLTNNIKSNTENNDKLVEILLKQNSDLMNEQADIKKLILEVCKNNQIVSINNSNQTNTNSHNKTFNLQLFLNETCKDAMNIMDFVDSLKLQLSDLEKVGELGYINGISEIIIKNLKALDVCKRPIHCTDAKREVLYVKDQDKWEKEDEENLKMRKAVKYVAHKNTKLLKDYREKYPDCEKSHSKKSDLYNKIVIETFGGGSSTEGIDCEGKIIKKIAKEVTIDK